MPDPGVTEPAGDPGPVPHELRFANLADDAPPPRLHIGNYSLGSEIGGGGNGVVYEAMQEHPRRKVAVKVMRSGLPTRAAVRRFEFESQLLARLRHPGIAMVYEAGIHRQGHLDVPFYAMEFIPDARPITTYADEHKMTLAQRLALFADVCDAVHHAHQQGIIHRDLKPENILVDSTGRSKVIDFGVARAPDSDLAPLTLQTRREHLMGTLPYMSPEQCDLDPAQLDARSDVYSLGVVLYELLCGRLPYDVRGGNLSDATRIIREEAPARLTPITGTASRDVETVVMKALQKERARRYQSAADLAADVRHVIVGEPIDARRDSATYVLKKRAGAMVAAHRIAMWVVVVVVALIAARSLASAMDAFTPTRLFFSRFMTTCIQPAQQHGHPPFENVRIVTMNDGIDFQVLAEAAGVTGIRVNEADKSSRIVHGLLLERIALGNPRVVVSDIFFARPDDPGTPCPHEMALVRGIQVLAEAGTPTVMAAGGGWKVGADNLPNSLCPQIAAASLWGFNTAVLSQYAPWSLELIFSPDNGPPMPSLALAACAAYWRPHQQHWVTFEVDRDAAAVYAKVCYVKKSAADPKRWGADAEDSVNLVRISQLLPAPDAVPEYNRKAGDLVGHYILPVPPDNVIAAATIDYRDAFAATPAQLRNWFEGKVVVIGDNRTGRDGPFPLPDGRKLHGFVAHAVGIDSILKSRSILPKQTIRLFGAFVDRRFFFDLSGAVLGGFLGLFAAKGGWRRLSGLTLLMLGLLITAILFYRQFQSLYDPVAAMTGAFLACESVAAITRVSGRRLI